MTIGRPSKIHTSVEVLNPETKAKEELPITEAICRLVSLGVWPGNAAQSYGVSRSTLHNWRQRGERALAVAAEQTDGDETDYELIGEQDLPYALFLDALTCAEAQGLAWHEINIRMAAQSNREAGGRLSLEFLSRRQREEYARNMKLEHGGKVAVEVEAEVDQAIDGMVEQLSAGKSDDPRAE
jgi:hypothetical protein